MDSIVEVIDNERSELHYSSFYSSEEEDTGAKSQARRKKRSPTKRFKLPSSDGSGETSDSSVISENARLDSNKIPTVANETASLSAEELKCLIDTLFYTGKELLALIKANKNTKREIKQGIRKFSACADKLRDNKKLILERAKKRNTVATIATQTGQETAVESLPTKTTFQAWKLLEGRTWSNTVFTSTEVVIGNPVEDGLPEETKVVFVEEEDQKMTESIQSQFKNRYPEIENLANFDVLEQFVKIKSRKTDKCIGKKIIKVNVPLAESDVFDTLVKLREETGREKRLALHHLKGMSVAKLRKMVQFIFKDGPKIRIFTTKLKTAEGKQPAVQNKKKNYATYAIVVNNQKSTAAETIKKINSSLGTNESKEVIKTIKSNKEGNLVITLEKNEKALETIGRDLEKSLGKDSVRLLKERQEKTSVFIRGMDAAATKDEVFKALKNKIPDLKEADVAIGEMRPYAQSGQAVTVRLQEKHAAAILAEPLRVGLVRCKLEKHLTIDRCVRCWAYDHATANCSGPDRRKCCYRCGKPDHRGKNCTRKEEDCICVLCNEKGHRPTSSKCVKFRNALNRARVIKRQQINADRSVKAHDMAFLEAAKRDVDLIVASEPNKKLIQNNPKWITDNLNNVAIFARTKNVKFSKVIRRDGLIVLFGAEYTIIACYISPNCTREQFDQYLIDLHREAAGRHGKLVIMGDFNAKSPDWGAMREDARGGALSQMMGAFNMVALNTGEPTFVRRQQQSCIDVTFVSQSLTNHAKDWQVIDDNEPYSPHRHIYFEIGKIPERKTRLPGIVKPDKHKFIEAFGDLLQRHPEVNSGKEISKIMKDAFRKACVENSNAVTGNPNPYWWTEQIDQKRKSCIKARRRALRAYANSNTADAETEALWQEYKEERKSLQKEISSRKKATWSELCKKLDDDIWGEGYKIVMRHLKPGNPFELTAQRKLEIAEYLFPKGSGRIPAKKMPVVFTPFSIEEVKTAACKLKSAAAPGPDGLSAEAVKYSLEAYPDVWLRVLNQALENQEFPDSWKIAKLILLLKPYKNSEELGSYRPICLIDAAAKLYEHLIKSRLDEELTAKHPLSDVQFGFRKGKSAMHAMTRVLEVARDVKNRRRGERWCALITLDVRNAFNSASWECIINELTRRNISDYLINVIKDYFANRVVKIDKETTFNMAMGIPQGSVLGPLLWNIMYDPILEAGKSENVTPIGYADDIALVVCGSDRAQLIGEANRAINRCVQWLTDHSLQIASEKTEAVILNGKRYKKDIFFIANDVRVKPKKSIRYLGVEFGENLHHGRHVEVICRKSLNKLGLLQRIMPTLDGPSSQKRQLLYGVVQSTLLYAAPIWGWMTRIGKYVRMLLSVQRKALLRVICAYRTVSYEAVQVLAGIPPIDLLIEERTRLNTLQKVSNADKKAARSETIWKWQQRWSCLAEKGQWTKKLIPNLDTWVSCKHKRLNYYLTQAFTGHGSFRAFTHRIGKTEPNCSHCGILDSAEHCIFRCPIFQTQRDELKACVNALTPVNLIKAMLKNPENWDRCSRAISNMMREKERQERILRTVVVPQNKFLLISQLHYAYYEKRCQHIIPELYLCAKESPIEIQDNAPCEVKLLSTNTAPTTCKQTHAEIANVVIDRLGSTNKWILVCPKKKSVQMLCPGRQSETRNLVGTFLCQIPLGCQVTVGEKL
ncbi:uncharacterized protein, partial [Euwallacea similis]|uniref:uncharacterized protein n=1 Tax=Euwallacea similis TaxID=1736056 RepID=UPI00344E1CE5